MATRMYKFILATIGGKNTKLAHNLDKSGRDWYNQRHVDYLVEKLALANKIKECEENGKVAILTSGMDCDGVRYSGQKSFVDAYLTVVEQEIDEANKWADGPIHMSIVKPSEARKVAYESRDLGMEAFEDGHPHVLYY
ncbi:MAG: hypothetical protein P4L79_10205 [Legionella sp.]|uniref:hypothetical protein n=1 Tax=Legionella sp. TaxID=459 RepID=UPI00284C63F1|nr:hypothetical protein [Legionella sp.]